MSSRIVWVTACALGCYVACGRDIGEDRPPPLPPCVDCGGPVGPAPSGQSGSAGGSMGGSGGAAGSGSMDETTLGGSVRVVTTSDLATEVEPSESLQVTYVDSGNRVRSVDTDELGNFVLEGLSRTSSQVTLVGPGEGAFGDYVPTLQTVDTVLADEAPLRLLRRSMMDELALIAYVDQPTSFDPEQASAFVQFVGESGEPLAGVSLVGIAQEAAIAFDAGGVYSDEIIETGDRGSMLLLNTAATAFPGGVLALNVAYAQDEYQLLVPVVRGAVTLHTARLSP